MAEKIVNVTDKYSHELLEIKNKLSQLENGRVYELSNAQMDGYLATNVKQLEKMIARLIYKIEHGEDSVEDRFSEIFGSQGE
ncbi:hypothetical protein [Bacillus sp. 2205SS5-2]|uniref:hypothetical protein n=1 Tax=Bacillus sp. 2205SS5-2 TaxID=3109031 RepID=UPI0030058EF6